MGKIKICINIKPQVRRRRDNKWTTKIHSSVNNINTKGKIQNHKPSNKQLHLAMTCNVFRSILSFHKIISQASNKRDVKNYR